MALTILNSNLSPQHRSTCYQTQQINGEISKIYFALKQQLRKNEYENIQKTIKSNEASTKKILHQRKFKKFNNLKYKPKAQIKATTIEETENTEKPTFAEILRKSRNPSRRQNLTTNLKNNTKPNMHERLRSMSRSNKHRKQEKSFSRTFSKTSNADDDK